MYYRIQNLFKYEILVTKFSLLEQKDRYLTCVVVTIILMMHSDFDIFASYKLLLILFYFNFAHGSVVM